MGNGNDSGFAKQSLKDKLTAIILLESSKSYEEMDGDLVTECVDFLMELEGKERLGKKEIEQRVENIPFKGKAEVIRLTKKKIKTRAVAAVAAVIAVLLMLLGITSIASDLGLSELIKNWGSEFWNLFEEGPVELDGITLYKADEEKTYSSINELVEAEGIELLYPSWLPENEKIVKIWYDVTNGAERYTFQFNNPLHSMVVNIDSDLSESLKENLPKKEIAGMTVYFDYRGQNIQANFVYKNNQYAVHSDTEENLFKIIENLEEIT